MLCRDTHIGLEHLPEEVLRAGVRTPTQADPESPLRGVVLPSDPDDAAIVHALEAHRWRRAVAAKALGMGRNTLWRHMKRLGLMQPSGGSLKPH